MKTRRHAMISIVVGLALLGGRATLADDPPTLASILADLKKNEAIYDDLDIVLRTHYTTGDREPGLFDPDMIITRSSELETHHVSQGRRFRVDLSGHDVGEDGVERPRDRVYAFDGATTRFVEGKVAGRPIEGRSESPDYFRPHMLPLRNIHQQIPLSTYLAGRDEMAKDPRARLQEGTTVEGSSRGLAEHEGLKCRVVWITTSFGGVPHDRWELWLAEERNDLPVRMLAYTFRTSKGLPVAEGTLDDLREIRPGVWFPFRAQVTAYDQMAMKAGTPGKLQWQYRHEAEKVSLKPSFPDDYFRDVEAPAARKGDASRVEADRAAPR